MRNTTLLLLFAALFACKTRKEANASMTPMDTKGGNQLISLATQGCRGWCPIYVLDFYTDGKVKYEGTRFVEKMGKSEFQLTPDELSRLTAEVKKANLWQYPENIESRVADAPYARLTVYDGAKSHPVSGSIDRPKPILELENMLKDLAEAHAVQVKKGVNPDDPALKLTAQVVVKLKPDVNAGNWAAKFNDEIKLRLVRRVSTENNWLVGYNPDQFTEKAITDLLKDLEGVLDVVPAKNMKLGN
jgi:hypothetical protein